MGINRNAVKRSFGDRTKAFIADNIHAIEEFLHPTLEGYALELRDLEGPRGRLLERSFREARTAWEKFFWVALGRHWIQNDEELEIAVQGAEDDLLSLSSVLETVVVLETLAVTEKVRALSRSLAEEIVRAEEIERVDRAPTAASPDRAETVAPILERISVTTPLSDLMDERIEDDFLDPTEEVDMARRRRVQSLGPVPAEHIRSATPEDTTIVEGVRGRPRLA
jgi:hypothetical protein